MDHYDYIISFLSPIIIPKSTLDKSDTKLNFHPGPPKYPGIGCYNFALHNGETMYGVVCHEMEEKVDTGRIILHKKFRISKGETVASLKEKSMLYLTAMFFEIMDNLEAIPPVKYQYSSIPWERKPYTHKDLESLVKGACVFGNIPRAEFEKWYNACYYPGAQDRPHIYIKESGKKYYIVREDHEYDRSNVSWNYTTQ